VFWRRRVARNKVQAPLRYAITRSRRALWASNQALEPEDASVHLHGYNGIHILDLQQTLPRSNKHTIISPIMTRTRTKLLFVGAKKASPNGILGGKEAARSNFNQR